MNHKYDVIYTDDIDKLTKLEDRLKGLEVRLKDVLNRGDTDQIEYVRLEICSVLLRDNYKKDYIRISKEYIFGGTEFDDIWSIVATKVYKKYDPTTNVPLIAYLRQTIKHTAIDEFRKISMPDPNETDEEDIEETSTNVDDVKKRKKRVPIVQQSLNISDESGKELLESIHNDDWQTEFTGNIREDMNPETLAVLKDGFDIFWMRIVAGVISFDKMIGKKEEIRSVFLPVFYTGILLWQMKTNMENFGFCDKSKILLPSTIPFFEHCSVNLDIPKEGDINETWEAICWCILKPFAEASWVPQEKPRPSITGKEKPMGLPIKAGVYRGYYAQVEGTVYSNQKITDVLKKCCELIKEFARQGYSERE